MLHLLLIAQFDAAAQVTETLANTEVNVLLVLVALVAVAVLGATGWMVFKLMSVVSEILTRNADALGGIKESTAAMASASRDMRNLLETVESEQRNQRSTLTTISTATAAGLQETKGSRTDIAEVQAALESGLRDTASGLASVNDTLNTQFASVMQRLDTLQDILETAQKQHAERESAIDAQFTESLKLHQQAIAQAAKNDKAYRERLNGVQDAVNDLRSNIETQFGLALAAIRRRDELKQQPIELDTTPKDKAA